MRILNTKRKPIARRRAEALVFLLLRILFVFSRKPDKVPSVA